MSWLSLLSGLTGQGGQSQGGGFGAQGAGQGVGQEAGQMGQAAMGNLMEFMGTGMEGMPPSLSAQLGQQQEQQMAAQTPEPSYGQFYMPGSYDGNVLPPSGPAPQIPDFLAQSQQVGSQGLPPLDGLGQGQMQQPQGMQQPQQGQQGQSGFGGLFNMTGTGEDPNIFLRLAEGYNRGGLMGSLGMGLTRM